MKTKTAMLLKNNRGQGAPLTLAVVLICLILSCVVYEAMRLTLIAQGVRDSVQSAMIDVATENWDEAYHGLREGYSGGYQISDTSWYENVSSGNVYGRLTDVLGIRYEGNRYVKYAGESMEYALSDLAIEVVNAPFAPDGTPNQMHMTGTIRLQVPLSFGWEQLPQMEITLKLKAQYIPKF